MAKGRSCSWTDRGRPWLIGHRGSPRQARENTLASFEAALAAGADGVELDVQLSRDGVPVVHHDATVIAPTGRMALATLPGAEIRGTTYISATGPYRVNTLGEVLAALGGRCLINVEVKPPAPERRDAVAAATVAAIRDVEPHGSILLSSFDAAVLEAVHRLDAAVQLGFLFTEDADLRGVEGAPIYAAVTWLHPVHELVDTALMERARTRQVLAWTADDEDEITRLVGLGVAAVITNQPERARPVMR